jgi:DNA modification methylase
MGCSKVSLSKRKFTGKKEEGLPPFYLRSPCDTRHVCTVTGSLFSLRSASSIFFVDRARWHTFPNSDATQSAEEKFAEARSNSVSSNAGRAPNLPLNASEADGVFAHLFGSAIPDVLEWKYTGNCFHPTQKPVSVLTPLVESFLNPGDVVLDPFCGSGSTLLAARELNCRFLGIELSKQYFDLAEQRLR